LKAKAREG
jgi:hypothetical protein